MAHNDHHHSGLALFTPAEVFLGRVAAVHATRQATLDAAYALHPNRFLNGPPKAALPPAEVHINPLEALVVSVDRAETRAPVNINATCIDDTPGSGSQKAPHATASTPQHEALAAAAIAFAS